MKSPLSVIAAAALLMSGCSGLDFLKNEKPATAEGAALPALEVPPTLAVPDPNASVDVPQTVSAAALEERRQERGEVSRGPVQSVDVASLEGPADARWLEVALPPEQLWPKLEAFLLEEGFAIERQDRVLGVIETAWTGSDRTRPAAEGLMGLMKRVASGLFSDDVQDKVRMRLETGDSAEESRVYLSHRRVERVEEETTVGEADTLHWEEVDASRGFENEMLVRLMVYLGVQEGDAQAMAAAAEMTPRARVERSDKEEVFVYVDQPQPLAYNRTLRALERLGFEIEKRSERRPRLYVAHHQPAYLAQAGRMTPEQIASGEKVESPLRMRLDVDALKQGGSRIEVLELEPGGLKNSETLVAERLSEMLR